MPLVRIDLRKGKLSAYRQEMGRISYEAMMAVGVGVPDNARFRIVSEHDADDFLLVDVRRENRAVGKGEAQ